MKEIDCIIMPFAYDGLSRGFYPISDKGKEAMKGYGKSRTNFYPFDRENIERFKEELNCVAVNYPAEAADIPKIMKYYKAKQGKKGEIPAEEKTITISLSTFNELKDAVRELYESLDTLTPK